MGHPLRSYLLLKSLSCEIEELLRLFAVILESPVLGVMVGIDDREHYALHVAGFGAGDIGAVEEVEGDGFAVGRRTGVMRGWLPAPQ